MVCLAYELCSGRLSSEVLVETSVFWVHPLDYSAQGWSLRGLVGCVVIGLTCRGYTICMWMK